MRGTLLALWALTCQAPFAPAADLVTLSPANYEEYAPRGDAAGAFLGDYVLRNDKIVVSVADPFLLSGRSASRWAIAKVGGAIVDLALRETPFDNLTAYYAGPMRFKPDAPNRQVEFEDESLAWKKPGREPRTGSEVELDLGAYEIESGKALAELAQLPLHLRGTPKPAVSIVYRLKDGDAFVRIEAVYTNPTDSVFRYAPETVLRADGDWESGLDYEGRFFWARHKWTQAAFGIVPDGHTLSGGAQGPRFRLRQEPKGGGGPAVVLPPHGSTQLVTRVFPGRDLFEVRAIAMDLVGVPARRVRASASSGGADLYPVEVLASAEGRTVGASSIGQSGPLEMSIPRDARVELTARAEGLEPLKRTVAPGETNSVTFSFPTQARIEESVVDDKGVALAHKTLVYGIDGTPSPARDAGAPLLVNYVGIESSMALRPGRYRVVFSAGPEFDCVDRTVELKAGETVKLDVTLARSVQTPGWIAAETHNHTARSGATELFYVYPYSKDPTVDGDSSEAGFLKLVSLVAEHVEFAPATEHNFAYSYAEELADLNLQGQLATCPGLGLTAGRRHTVNHQNTFPVPYVKGRQDGGALQRPEHIQQLTWLAQWEGRSNRVIQIVQPLDLPLSVAPEMDVLDVIALEPIVERKPIAGMDNRILDWLEKLNAGYRLPAVCNAGRFESRQETGRTRNYVRSATDDPAAIDPVAIALAMKRGQVMMTTGPFMEVEVSPLTPALSREGRGSSIMDDVAAPGGKVSVRVRVQCANWTAVDRVQVLTNGVPALERTRAAQPASFDRDGSAFVEDIPLTLAGDAHVIVVASGTGRDLHDKTGNPEAKRLHVAVSNPVFVDVDGKGCAPQSPLKDKVETSIEFIDPPLALAGAEPGRVRAFLSNGSGGESRDTISLLIRPPGTLRVIGPVEQPYRLGPGDQGWIDWLVAVDEEYLGRTYPARSSYNNATSFGVGTARSGVPPGRKPASMWMKIDHPVASLPPLSSPGAVAAALAGARPFPLVLRTPPALAELRLGVAGPHLAVWARVADPKPRRREVAWEGSCLEIFGALPGRDAETKDGMLGAYHPVRQVYLVPPTDGKPAEGFTRIDEKIVPAPGIELLAKPAPGGYELNALVPLDLLGLDLDAIARAIYLPQSGLTSVELVGKQAVAGRFLLEARVTVPGAGGAPSRGTIFGSSAPHVDHSAFGRMRLIGPVACRLDIESPLPAEPGQAPARVRLTLSNSAEVAAADVATLRIDPPGAAEVEGAGAFPYSLAPGAVTSRVFRIDASGAGGDRALHLVVPRSPRGEVVGTPSPLLPVGARPLPDLGPLTLAEAARKLADRPACEAMAGSSVVARVRFALAGRDLAIAASVEESQLVQTEPVWKGSCVEVFGALPGATAESIGQVFLVPAAGDAPARALRKAPSAPAAAPEVRIESVRTATGYDLTALVPLDLLRLGGHAGRLALEIQVDAQAGAKRRFATVFGSPRAYQDSTRYGVFEADTGRE